ncbi:phosphatase PAP2 family protein [Methyloligella sp. 2.7D]|uniref:phosphatase PAP2 family protein n=1 Tax=unclassified Methyloligella TaxID=2625955 RepID=UPI00157D308E|nr:phosphatase PAP2 family protein [Methyloligella sp. GL2]QKP76615.1 phosphatase PAP2 family protein [Methyloligella sp. GL2]
MQERLNRKLPAWVERIVHLSRRDKLVLIGSVIAFGMFFIDPAVYRWARDLDPNVRAIFKFITDIGKSGWVLILTGTLVMTCVALGYRASHRRLRIGRLYAGQVIAFIFLAVATTGIAASLLKNSIGRARPKLFELDGSFHFSPFAFDSDFASFPSGHSTTTFALATALALLMPRIAVPIYAAAAWIAASRFLTGAHYVSDVVAGAALGIGGTLLLREVMCRRRSLFERRAEGAHLRGQRLGDWVLTELPDAVMAWIRSVVVAPVMGLWRGDKQKDTRPPRGGVSLQELAAAPEGMGALFASPHSRVSDPIEADLAPDATPGPLPMPFAAHRGGNAEASEPCPLAGAGTPPQQ